MHFIPRPTSPLAASSTATTAYAKLMRPGRGRIVIRAKAEIEQKAEHELIVVTEIPTA